MCAAVAEAKHSNNYISQMANLLGALPELTLQVNYGVTGNVLPQGTIIDRTFGEQHYDLYVQDSWKALIESDARTLGYFRQPV
jgi:hypothetical protein